MSQRNAWAEAGELPVQNSAMTIRVHVPIDALVDETDASTAVAPDTPKRSVRSNLGVATFGEPRTHVTPRANA